MENIVHKIYHLTFPNGEDYVGSSYTPFYQRYASYRGLSKKSKSPILEISTRYKFKEVKMIEVDRIECIKGDSKVRMLEEEWRKKLNPTLNVNRAYRTEQENNKLLKKWADDNRKYVNNYIREYDQTPKGKLNRGVADAKQNIKNYTKQNRPDMVKKWESILEVRIQSRLASQSS